MKSVPPPRYLYKIYSISTEKSQSFTVSCGYRSFSAVMEIVSLFITHAHAHTHARTHIHTHTHARALIYMYTYTNARVLARTHIQPHENRPTHWFIVPGKRFAGFAFNLWRPIKLLLMLRFAKQYIGLYICPHFVYCTKLCMCMKLTVLHSK